MSLSNDLNQIKSNGAASTAEIQEFVRNLRGKPPQEVLGMVAQSGLTQGIVVALVLTVVGMGLMTVVPYMMGHGKPPGKKPVAQAAGENEPVKPAATTTAADIPAATADAAAPAGKGEPSAANKADVLSKLGLDETKVTDPKKNPLEDKADDLLKDLK
jgi:hypothetical protein